MQKPIPRTDYRKVSMRIMFIGIFGIIIYAMLTNVILVQAQTTTPSPDETETIMTPVSETEAVGLAINKNGTHASFTGPEDWFTGRVRIEMLFSPIEPARAGGSNVTFEPGSRTAWHSHEIGQTLIITSGSGLVQLWGAPIQVVNPGDIVQIAPDQKHWHGASPNSAMTHISILEGGATEWMEHVSDEQYNDN